MVTFLTKFKLTHYPSAALAALLAKMPRLLKKAKFACKITGFDTEPVEALEYHDRVLRDLRDWLAKAVRAARAARFAG